VGRTAMFPQIDALPGSQAEPASLNGNTKGTVGKNRTHVGWHIVRPLGRMLEIRIAVGHAARHECFEITPYRRVSILAQYQRRARMPKKQMSQACGNTRFDNDIPDPFCYVDS